MLKQIFRILSFVLVCCVLMSIGAFASSVSATSKITVLVNGNEVEWTDAKPLIDSSDRAIAPMRPIADALGIEVEWDAANKTAVFTGKYMVYTRVVYAKIGEKSLLVETYHPGTPDNRVVDTIALDTSAVIINDRTYAPIRSLANAFGYAVQWNPATRTADIITDVIAGINPPPTPAPEIS